MDTSLRRRLGADESIQEMELAGGQRLREGETLLLSGFPGAAIYLAGYAVEMALKTAYFRFADPTLKPTSPVRPMLVPALRRARSMIPAIAFRAAAPRAGHDLLLWGILLRKTRNREGKNWPPEFDARYLNAVRMLDRMWWVEMRYKPDGAGALEARMAIEKARWLWRYRGEIGARR